MDHVTIQKDEIERGVQLLTCLKTMMWTLFVILSSRAHPHPQAARVQGGPERHERRVRV